MSQVAQRAAHHATRVQGALLLKVPLRVQCATQQVRGQEANRGVWQHETVNQAHWDHGDEVLDIVAVDALGHCEEVPVAVGLSLHVSSVSIVWVTQLRRVISHLPLVLLCEIEVHKVIIEGRLPLKAFHIAGDKAAACDQGGQKCHATVSLRNVNRHFINYLH